VAASHTVGSALSQLDETEQHVVLLVGETVGELMDFWGFRRAMGIIWTALYLSDEALTQDALMTRTGLSIGAVSTTLSELTTWGVVRRVPTPGDRRRHYVAETDIKKLVLKVFRERELRKVEQMIEHLDEALELLAEGVGQDSDRRPFLRKRLRALRTLTVRARRLLSTLIDVGTLDLSGWRDLLGDGRNRR
jgi:DNA-binding transcriptional regulator GbsR (MarR family)